VVLPGPGRRAARPRLAAAQGVAEGKPFKLDLPEKGAVGQAWAWKVEPVRVPRGPGRLVTGWFCHSEGQAYDLRVEGEPGPVGVTPMHPVYAPDRGRYVPAIELRPGERLLAADGSTPRVVSLTLRAGPEPVYNIEVDGDHCYRVGQQGLLVHNMSAPARQDECDRRGVTVAGPAGARYITSTINLEWPDGGVRDYRVTYQTIALLRLAEGDDASGAIRDLYRMPCRFIDPRPNGDPVPPPGTRMDWLGHMNGMDTAGHIVPRAAGGRASASTTENSFPQGPLQSSRHSCYGDATQWLYARMRDQTHPDERFRCDWRICVHWVFYFTDRTYPFRPSRVVVKTWLDRIPDMGWDCPND
jgi:hypothetical protein